MDSTLAPSEKHLEDWIIANPDTFGDEHTGLLRQYALPSGITDLIFYGGGNPLVLIELKKGKINAAAVTQTLRYLRDLKQISKLALDMVRHPMDAESRRCDPPIDAFLIGHSVEDPSLLISAEMGGISILTYEYDSSIDDYEFFDHKAERIDLEVKYSYAKGLLGGAIQDAFIANAKRRGEHEDGLIVTDMLEVAEIFMLKTKYGFVPLWEYVQNRMDEEDNPGGAT